MPIVSVGKQPLQVVETASNRQEFIEQLEQELGRVVRTVVSQCLATALEEEVNRLLGRKLYARRRHSGARESPRTACNGCHSHKASDFRRNGHRERGLETHWGHVIVSVPQIECQCGHAVQVRYQTLQPRQRFWDDLGQEIRAEYTRGLSLRYLKDRLDPLLGGSVGLRTLNQQAHSIAGYARAWQKRAVKDIPPVIRVDGLWVKLMLPTPERRKDARGRNRAVHQVKRLPVLIAQGVWPASGRQTILTWLVGAGEDQASWEDLLFQLREMGIFSDDLALLIGDGSPGFEAARQVVYPTVPFQRCIFHKMRNLLNALVVPQGMDRATFREYQRPLLEEAGQIWRAPTQPEARTRQQAVCQRWGEAQPAAVAVLQRDFEQTLTFYPVQQQAAERGEVWPAEALRTTSPLERENREFRRRIRTAVLFHSEKGLMAAIYQNQVFRETRREEEALGKWVTRIERQIEDSRSFLT
jgi:putative transposase